MTGQRIISVVGCHCEGEVGDVIVGGVRDVPGTTMHEKMVNFARDYDPVRKLLLNEPRGRGSMSANLLLPPCDPRAEAGFLIMGSGEYATMSGSNTICTATVLLETGQVAMREPETRFCLEAPAGLVSVAARCEGGRCRSVCFDNVPAYVHGLDLPVELPGVGVVRVDVAFGGMWYALVDAAQLGLSLTSRNCTRLIELGNLLKRCINEQLPPPVHAENPKMAGVGMISITEPVTEAEASSSLAGRHCVIVPPGRCDRSPCGTGTSARLAVLHARGLLQEQGQTLEHESIIGSKFVGRIREVTRVGEHKAIVPSIEGRAWITSYKQVVLDPSDPYPEGFQVGDHWVMDS